MERLAMRLLTIIVAILASLWGGYWFVGSSALERAAKDWFTTQSAARYTGLSVAGFPNRFDLTVEGLHLEAPGGRLTWDAPTAKLYAMTWKPWHIIAALPSAQTLTLPDQVITLTSTNLQGSLSVAPDTRAELNELRLIGAALEAASSAGWTLAAGDLSLAARRDASAPDTYEIGLRITDLTPDPALMTALLGKADLPPAIGLIHADARVTLSAPLDRFAGDTHPQLTKIALADASLEWGSLKLTGKGDIAPDADGLAQGRIDWTLENWQVVPDLVVETGLVKPEIRPTVERMLQVLADQSPDPKILSLPLILQNGRMSLGPFPLGPAPRLN
jgi:hypothetical protein